MTQPWSNQGVSLIVIDSQTGTFTGLFIYDPAPGQGNLMVSIAPAAGTDPYGNAYPAGIFAQAGFFSGSVSQFQGTNFVINQSGLFFYQGILPPPSGLGTPYLIGSLPSTTAATTLTLPVATATTAGDAVIVCANANGTDTVTGVTDTKGNTYSLTTSATAESNAYAYTYVALNSTALTTADTITVTYSGTADHSVSAVGCSGVATASALDPASGSAGANSTAPSFTSGTLAQASELAIAFEASGNGGGAFTWTGWTSITGGNVQTGGGPYSDVAAQTVQSTAALKASGTLAATGHWSMTLLLLKAA